MRNCKRFTPFKVLAGIVMCYKGAEPKVVSIGCGTKWLTTGFVDGTILHDFHAEILARRGFILFLAHELIKCINKTESVIRRTSSKQFKLKPGVEFHLYVSTAPCGDGRVYSKGILQELEDGVVLAPLGSLRPKGTSCLTFTSQAETPSQELFAFQPTTHFMSCSAKLLRWGVLGIQGAILSNFLDPIYLASLVIGQGHEAKNNFHLSRAIYGRIKGHLKDLPPKYSHKAPKIHSILHATVPSTIVPPDYSIDWNCSTNKVEILNSFRGRELDGGVSQISKWQYFFLYHNIMDLMGKTALNYYLDAKKSAKNYQVSFNYMVHGKN